MKRFSKYIAGLSPWIFAVAGIGFVTRLRVFGDAGTNRTLNYFVLGGIALLIYSVVIILYFNGIELKGFEYNTPEKNMILNCFDCSVFFIVILLLLGKVREIGGLREAIIMCMVSMAVSVLSLIAERDCRMGPEGEDISGNEAGGKVVLAAIFAFVCGLSVLIFKFAFSGIEKISDVIAGGIRVTGGILFTVLKFIAGILWRILEWLASLMPADDGVSVLPDEAPGIEIDEIPQVYSEVSVPVWVYYVLAGIIVVALAIFVKRNLSFSGKKVKVQKNRRVKRSRAAKGNAFGKLKADVSFAFCCLKYKRTVPGLFIYCEKHAPKGLERRKGESGEAFLRRVTRNPEILELADMVEKQFYSGSLPEISKEKYRGIIDAWKHLETEPGHTNKQIKRV